MNLELYRQHFLMGGQNGQRGVPTRHIDETRHDAAVK
jgi:hypothetical protein